MSDKRRLNRDRANRRVFSETLTVRIDADTAKGLARLSYTLGVDKSDLVRYSLGWVSAASADFDQKLADLISQSAKNGEKR